MHEGNGTNSWTIRLAVLLVGTILTTLGGVGGIVLRHEGEINRWQGHLEILQRTLERMEAKIDAIGKKQ